MFYRLAYWVGFTPWERASETHGQLIGALLDREQSERQPPYGSALDLGCGTGRWSVDLARRGWNVVGVDAVPKALRGARVRAQNAGVDVRFLRGDVTSLGTLGVGTGIDFFLDVGCFHGLSDSEREAMGRGVTSVASTDATFLVLVWKPGRRGPLPRGASRSDLEGAFSGWKVIAEDPMPAAALPKALQNADPRCYRLRRG
jgi:SAM-dependent methyltransferase